MNKLKYIVLRSSLLLKGIIPSLLFLFGPRKKDRIVFNSEFNRTYKHNSKFLFEYMINSDEFKKFDIKFVINDSDLRRKLNLEVGNYFIETNTLTGIIKVLLAGTWVVSSLETPVGGVFLNFRRNVHHLGHGVPVKRIGVFDQDSGFFKKLYYSILRTNFTFLYSTSEAFIEAWSLFLNVPTSRVVVLPQARCEFFREPNHIREIKDSYKMGKGSHVLYAPTWRPNSDIRLFPFKDFDAMELSSFLEKNQITIYLRVHPNFEEKIPQEIANLDGIVILDSFREPEISDVLPAFDLVISDYSSIYIDFLITEKPVLFVPYDVEEYSEIVGFSVDYNFISPGPKVGTLIDFKEQITKLLEDDEYFLIQRKNVNNTCNSIISSPSKICADFVISHLN